MSSNRLSDRWGLSRAWIEGVPALVRYRVGLDDVSQIWPHLLRIEWLYETNDISLLPTASSEEAMIAFENLLVPAIENDPIGILAAVITHNLRRRWYFYTAKVDDVMEVLHAIPQQDEPYPLKISRKDMDFWSFYKDVVAQYGADGEE